MANTKIPAELSSTPGIADSSNATAITIDSSEKTTFSGDVEVGTTAPKINLKNTDTSIVADQSLGVIEVESSDGSTGSAGTIAKLDIAASGAFDGSGHGSEFIFTVGATNQSGSIALTEAMRITSTANVELGGALTVDGFSDATGHYISLRSDYSPDQSGGVGFQATDHSGSHADGLGAYGHDGITFYTAQSEVMRISSDGDVSIGTTSNTNQVADASSGDGFAYSANSTRDFLAVTRDSGVTAYFNRIGNGDVVAIRKNGSTKGTISVNDATVSYNPFMGSHYSETSDGEILLGTVMEYTGELVENYNVEEKRLSKVKISDTSESTKVYGIYFADGDELGGDLIAGLGASWCRINKDVTVQLGDLLVSNGDGTAMVQSDDIIRSKTIGKVTSTTVKETYSDGSYVVPVVLYCG